MKFEVLVQSIAAITDSEIWRSLTAKSPNLLQGSEMQIVRTASAQLGAPPHLLVERLSYSHFELPTAAQLQTYLDEQRRLLEGGKA